MKNEDFVNEDFETSSPDQQDEVDEVNDASNSGGLESSDESTLNGNSASPILDDTNPNFIVDNKCDMKSHIVKSGRSLLTLRNAFDQFTTWLKKVPNDVTSISDRRIQERITSTTRQMMLDRGNIILNETKKEHCQENEEQKFCDVHNNVKVALSSSGFVDNLVCCTKHDPMCLTICILSFKSKFGIVESRTLHSACNEIVAQNDSIKLHKLVLITKNKISHQSIKLVSSVFLGGVQTFMNGFMMFPYPYHQDVPQQTKISEPEKLALFNANIKELQKLPKMCLQDPIAKYFDWKPGDVIKCTRRIGGTTGTHVTYRVVVE
jgi:DNA-directed RNA polymerase subunit H (RpoH/RPB5)